MCRLASTARRRRRARNDSGGSRPAARGVGLDPTVVSPAAKSIPEPIQGIGGAKLLTKGVFCQKWRPCTTVSCGFDPRSPARFSGRNVKCAASRAYFCSPKLCFEGVFQFGGW